MTLDIISCRTPKQIRDFIEVPFCLHKNNPNWVPPLKEALKKTLYKKNPFFNHAEMHLWVVYRKGRPVGRIAGIINHLHNQIHHQTIAFWGFFESEPSSEVSRLLFNQVEEWAIEHSATALRGPMNPSTNHECGLQISAFETKPFVMMPQNPDYYPTLVEQQDYKKIKDLQAWIIDIKQARMNRNAIKTIKQLQEQYEVTIRPIKMDHFLDEISLITHIFNDAWEKNWGFLPLSVDEFRYMASDLKSIALPNFIYIAEIASKPCAFSVGLPDLNQVLLNIRNGRLFPLNFFKLLWKLKVKPSITQGRIPLLGVLQEYQHIPIGMMLYYEYLKHGLLSKCLQAEFSWILEDNHRMQAALKLVNAHHYKTYRIYEKALHC